MPFLDKFRIKRNDNGNAANACASPRASDLDTSWPPYRDRTERGMSSSTASSAILSNPSCFADADLQNDSPDAINDIKCEVMVNWLHSKQEESVWTSGDPGEGVVLKKSKGRYVCCPVELQDEDTGFYQSIAMLNVRVAMTVNTRVIKLLLGRNSLPFVQLSPGLRLQVIPDIQSLPFCQKHQSAAFIASQQILVVWEDDPKRLVRRVNYLQDNLMKMIWGELDEPEDDKKDPFTNINSFDGEEVDESLEEGPRRIVLIQSLLTAATMVLVCSAIGGGWRNIAIELYVDRDWTRIAFAACIGPQIWLALFFFQALVGNIAQLIGPIGQMVENTKFYSGLSPRLLPRDREGGLPHVTIQMPVYKEGLHSVIEPTIRSIKQAISTYELQGGTANIFVNDDGMKLLTHDQAMERQDFYDEHNVGWVARPKHNPSKSKGRRWRFWKRMENDDQKHDLEPIFYRRGKFKKASNMNYALWVSVELEKRMANLHRPLEWSQRDENLQYGMCLRQMVQEYQGQIWADGNIRVGDYILLVDSDTRVPKDCLYEAVSEMESSPQVAILQYASGVMNVTDSFFEKGITFFTNLIYTQIRYAVANGDVAPFVGHNAILRWSAVQSIAYDCEQDNREKYWSEETVSEDFDMALRLQTDGYLVRLGAYKDNGFKEGVSLTVYDELARWEKYAYGCNELIFHPLPQWWRRGPFTKLFRTFIFSGMPLPSKFTIMAYVGTYYALGSAWLLTLVNYFLIGWFNGFLDHYYTDSFKVYFAIIIVFTALGNVALAVLRYRIGESTLVGAMCENFKWIPLLIVFLGGVSLHVSQALLSHMFGMSMQWGATAKEVENVSFFEEIPRVIKRFKGTFIFCVGVSIMMAVFALAVPEMWRITFFTPIWPLACVVVCHFLMPIVLNPNLMLFTW